MYPAHILRHIQINIYEYFQAMQISGGAIPEPPEFQSLHGNLGRGSFQSSPDWLPLPPSLTVARASTLPTPTAEASVATRTTRASTAASTISGLTVPSGTAGACTAEGRTVGTHVPNTARDAEFDALQLRPQMRDLLRLHPPPRNDSGDEFCVSWWGRGGCYSNCNRASTHRPFANANERGRLLAHAHAWGQSPRVPNNPYASTHLTLH